MRILIVNAHLPNPDGQRVFQELLVCTKEILKARNGLLEVDDEYIIRSKDNVDDFLFDEHTSYSRISCGRHFDGIDFVIISGDENSLPWHSANNKILILIKMCLRVKKCLFAIGAAMQGLVYLSATNLDTPIKVVNGNGKGGKLGDMNKLHINPSSIGALDHFLDSVTGDLYNFQHESSTWAPLCNVGLHHSRTAQEYNTLGKYIINTPVYRPKKSITSKFVSSSAQSYNEHNEIKCYVKKIFLKHWLFEECNNEFIVPYKGKWEVHPFSFTNGDRSFEVLAESEHGPMIIELTRMVGVKFLISKKFKDTFGLLSNFINKYSSDLLGRSEHDHKSIVDVVDEQRHAAVSMKFRIAKHVVEDKLNTSGTLSPTMKNGQLPTLSSTNGFDSGRTSPASRYLSLTSTNLKFRATPVSEDGEKTFTHSGLASKMKGKHLQKTNNIGENRLFYDTPDDSMRESEKGTRASTSTKKNVQININQSLLLNRLNSKTTILKSDGKYNSPKTNGVSIFGNLEAVRANQHKQQQPRTWDKHDEDQYLALSQREMKRILYPDSIGDVTFNGKVDRLWIPGNLSERRLERAETEGYGYSPVIRVIPDGLKSKRKLRLNTEESDTKTIRISDPYKTWKDIDKEYKLKESMSSKCVGERNFFVVGKNRNGF